MQQPSQRTDEVVAEEYPVDSMLLDRRPPAYSQVQLAGIMRPEDDASSAPDTAATAQRVQTNAGFQGTAPMDNFACMSFLALRRIRVDAAKGLSPVSPQVLQMPRPPVYSDPAIAGHALHPAPGSPRRPQNDVRVFM